MTQWLEVDGTRLEARWVGPVPGDAPTLVFLHEGLGSAGGWRDFPDRLAEATGCGALVYSREGYGLSSPLRQPFGPDFMHREARRLPLVLEAAGVRQAALVGHSDGGSIALIAAAHGLPASALVLEAPHVFVEDRTVDSIAAAGRRFDHGDLRTRLERQHGASTEATFRAWTGAWLDPAFRSWSLAGLLPSVTCPVLAVMGDDDPYGTYRQLDALEASCRGPVQQMRIAGARHAPHRQHPEIVLPAMAAFLRRLLGS